MTYVDTRYQLCLHSQRRKLGRADGTMTESGKLGCRGRATKGKGQYQVVPPVQPPLASETAPAQVMEPPPPVPAGHGAQDTLKPRVNQLVGQTMDGRDVNIKHTTHDAGHGESAAAKLHAARVRCLAASTGQLASTADARFRPQALLLRVPREQEVLPVAPLVSEPAGQLGQYVLPAVLPRLA